MAGPGAPPIVVSATVDIRVAESLLTKLIIHTSNLTPVWRARVGPSIAAALTKQFETRGAALGTPWAPITEATIRARFRVVRDDPKAQGPYSTTRPGRGKRGAAPMQDTLTAWGSFVKLATPLGIRVYEPLFMAWGSAVPYMAPHHTPGGFYIYPFGNKKAHKVHVPARFVIPPVWPAAMVAEWAADIADFLVGVGPLAGK